MEKEIYDLYKTSNIEFDAEINNYENSYCLNFLFESKEFKGYGPYYLDKVNEYIKQLFCMSETLSGECCIFDTESTNNIRIFFENRSLFVKGTIGDYGQHLLSFSFRADQTLISALIRVLKKLL